MIKNMDLSKDISLDNHSGNTFLDNTDDNLPTSRIDFQKIEESKLDMNSEMPF